VLDYFARPCCEPFKPRAKSALPYELDKPMVTAGISKVKASVIRCGEQASAKGIVKIDLVVGGDGRVQSASVSDAPDAALGECVAAAVRRAAFAKTEKGGSFTYPFAF
jgi:hypothetical protein